MRWIQGTAGGDSTAQDTVLRCPIVSVCRYYNYLIRFQLDSREQRS